MIRDQEITAEKEVQLAGGKYAVLAAVVHRVDHHEQIRGEPVLLLGGILVNLGGGTGCDTILNGQRMEVENVLQHVLGLLGRWAFQVHPEKEVGVTEQGRHQEHIDVLAV